MNLESLIDERQSSMFSQGLSLDVEELQVSSKFPFPHVVSRPTEALSRVLDRFDPKAGRGALALHEVYLQGVSGNLRAIFLRNLKHTAFRANEEQNGETRSLLPSLEGMGMMGSFILIKVVTIGTSIIVNALLSNIILDMMQSVIHQWGAG